MSEDQRTPSTGADSTIASPSSDEGGFLLSADPSPSPTAPGAELITSSGAPLRSDAGEPAPEPPQVAAEPAVLEPVMPVERAQSHQSSSPALVVTQSTSKTNQRRLLAPALAAAVIGGALLLFGRRYLRDRKRLSEVEETISINRPARELYDFWREFTNLPQFMDNIKSVETLGFRRSHWVIKAPAGTSVEFDSRVVDDIPGKLIEWSSEEGATVPNRGRVEFSPEGPRSTLVRVTLSYDPPAGAAGQLIAKLFQREPATQARQDLARFKQIMETREASAATKKAAEAAAATIAQAAERTSEVASQAQGALATYSGTFERATADMQAVSASTNIAAQGASQLVSAWVEWMGKATRAQAEASRRIIQCTSITQLAEVHQDMVTKATQNLIESNANLLEIAQETSKKALSPLQAQRTQ